MTIPRHIHDASARWGVPRNLLAAIVEVESAGRPYAMRAEPHYRWLWDVRLDKAYRGEPEKIPAPRGRTSMTELWGQRTSWGLMQIMGAVGRERGYDGQDLCGLTDVETNLRLGCQHLVSYYRKYQDWEQAVAAYNAGSVRRLPDGTYRNQQYVDRIRQAGGLRA